MEGRPFFERDPCPDRILDDVGTAFAMGAVGGSAYYSIKGLHNSPRGARIAGVMEAMHMNVPRVAGGFAVWGGLYSACDCALVFARQKEDPYNAILAGAATGGILSLVRASAQLLGHPCQGPLHSPCGNIIWWWVIRWIIWEEGGRGNHKQQQQD